MNVSFYQLGCDKNKCDSEKILKFLSNKYDINIVDDPIDSEVCIVNTCAFIKDAKIESINLIKDLEKLKGKKGSKLKKIVVLGCLTNDSSFDINTIINKKNDYILNIKDYLYSLNKIDDRINDILSFSSPVKISDGCNKKCSYCIIPKLRGKFHSNKMENILKEVKNLAKNGVTELSIVAQDTLSYGIDLYKKKMTVPLINEISKIDGIKWIRLMYCYPESIDKDLIKLIKTNKKVLHYIDMPIQHTNDNILKSMNRATRCDAIKKVINNLRKEIPDIIIRTTFIVGYPGETEKEYNELIKFLKEMKLDKVGAFAYSKESGTIASTLKNQVPESIKKKRLKNLLSIQKKIVEDKKKEYIGKTYECIIEGYDTKTKTYIARSYMDARDIDECVRFKSKHIYVSGEYIKLKIKSIKNMDLEAEET